MKMIKELREKRNKLAVAMRDLHELAEKEERGFSADEQASWDKMVSEIEALDQRITRASQIADVTGARPAPLRAGGEDEETRGGLGHNGGPALEDPYSAAFRNFLRFGTEGLDEEQRALVLQHRRSLSQQEQRTFSGGAGNTGGFTVPQDFMRQLEVALREFGGMMEAADVFPTDTGATLPMPTFNYTSVLATIVGEGGASVINSATPFGVANLGSFTYRSPMLPISYELLQDSAFGEQYIIDALAGTIARALNAHATTGTGTGQPRGVVTDAVSGRVGATGQTATVIYNDLVDLVHSLDPAYRRNARFMMHDQSVRVVRRLQDSTGRPLWLPGYESGIGAANPDTLMGYAYSVNQDMPQMAANARSILFGDFKKYKLRMVRDVTLLRLTERYADQLQVGFMMFLRADGRLLDAGTNPVRFYQNSAT